MELDVMQRRRFLFDRIYRRTLDIYSLIVPTPLRWALEALLLVSVRHRSRLFYLMHTGEWLRGYIAWSTR